MITLQLNYASGMYFPCFVSLLLIHLIKCASLNFVLVVVFLTTISSIFTYKTEVKSEENLTIGNIMFVIMNFLGTIILFVQIAQFYAKQNIFLSCFYNLHEIDQEFHQIGLFFTYRCSNWLTFTITCAFFFGFFFWEYFSEIAMNTKFQDQIFHSLGFAGVYILRNIPVYYFFVFTLFIIVRIDFLNKEVIKCKVNLMEKQKFCRKLSTIANLHFKLCKLAKSVNSSFPMSMLGMILETSCTMVIFIFIFFGDNSDRKIEIIYMTFMDVFPTWSVLIACEVSSFKVRS